MIASTPSARAITSIVVGTDFSVCSAVALGQAIRIARPLGAKLHVVHVIDTTVVIEVQAVLTPLQQGIEASLIRDARQAWAELARAIPGTAEQPIEVSINNRIVGILKRARVAGADVPTCVPHSGEGATRVPGAGADLRIGVRHLEGVARCVPGSSAKPRICVRPSEKRHALALALLPNQSYSPIR